MIANTESDQFALQRHSMVELQLRARGIHDQRVLEAMAHVPRHVFVSERYREEAYEDHPLPIGFGQTISQPYIVARMLEVIAVQPTDTVLEIGTGSGYVTALLAELAARLYSMERHQALAENAARVLADLGYTNIKVIVGDGNEGLPDKAPFDAILVSAAAPQLPSALLDQLGEGGRMIVPVGPSHTQELQLVRKLNGELRISYLEGCRFVPLISGAGHSDE